MDRHVARMGKWESHSKFSSETWREGRLVRPSYGWEDNIKMYLKEGVDWIHLAQDRDGGRVLWTR
jgi:hypothetical protein